MAIFGASVFAFIFMRVFPGNPARLIVGPLASNEAIVQQEKAMGLDKPLWVQYWRYIKGIFTGDWGFAYSAGETVKHEIFARLPASAELGLYAFLFAFVLAVILALAATYRHRPWVDGTRENFIVVVRSKGLGRWPAFSHHALPNAFLPTLTASGLLLAQLISGSVLVEKVFNWPGIGALIVDSILRQDFAVVQTFVLL